MQKLDALEFYSRDIKWKQEVQLKSSLFLVRKVGGGG